MSKFLPVKTVGPALPSMFLDKRLPDDRQLEVRRPDAHSSAECVKWLNERGKGSVVYVAFGRLVQLGKVQMEELAWGLELSKKHFLWVVRSSEQWKVPEELVRCKVGMVVPWCEQVEVLSHEAIGCFVTHCGWNSTLEAVSLGVPMVGMPQWTDQPTNAKFVEDVWKVGIRARAAGDGENGVGVVGRETIERCIMEIMEGERGKEIRSNAASWKEVARAAMDDGGSSDRNILQFIQTSFGSESDRVLYRQS